MTDDLTGAYHVLKEFHLHLQIISYCGNCPEKWKLAIRPSVVTIIINMLLTS